jgi:hypothetical protein
MDILLKVLLVLGMVGVILLILWAGERASKRSPKTDTKRTPEPIGGESTLQQRLEKREQDRLERQATRQREHSPTPETQRGLPRSEQQRHWAVVRRQFRDHLGRMASYEIDPALAIDFPAFNDVSVPEVSAMVKALRSATALEDTSDQDASIGGSPELLSRFESAVQDFGTAVDNAERAARELRWSHLGEADRADLKQIRALLSHAENPGNTGEARRSYYAQLQKVIRRLNARSGHEVVTGQALAAIEDSARLALN